MGRRRPGGLEWSLEEIVDLIEEAGFDGLDVYLHRASEARRAKAIQLGRVYA
ncbi:MAG: hypothetical protein OER77_15350 [Myxococcales bacterium]|nr:hypothetical protein [Myxococcales bacterium]